jgi:ubiquilin
MQQQMMSNPDLFRQMLDNPMVQSLMSNPNVIRDLMMTNPQMQDLLERNPEIQQMINNPSLMRQMMEVARNPAAFQELMRNQDRAISNIESMPGGLNALQRIYQDIEEPMMNAARDTFTRNPFAALLNNNSDDNVNRQMGTENTEPLPNPWAPRTQTTSTSSTTTTTTTTTTSANNPQPSMLNPFSAIAGGSPSTNPLASGMAGGLFNTPGMQNYLQQIQQNPRLMESIVNTPYMQSITQTLASNPDLTRQIMENNPLLQSNPEMRETLMRSMPTLLQQLQNPEMQQLLTNPEALQAVLQIQQGMQRLQEVAPGLLRGLGFPNYSNPTATTTTTTPSTTTSTPQQQTPFSNLNPNSSNYFAQMLNMMANNTIVRNLSSNNFNSNSINLKKNRASHQNKDLLHN